MARRGTNRAGDPQQELAEQLGADFAEVIARELPRIREALSDGRQATIRSLPITFKHHEATDKQPERLTAKIKSTSSIPGPIVERQLEIRGKQLCLFDAAGASDGLGAGAEA